MNFSCVSIKGNCIVVMILQETITLNTYRQVASQRVQVSDQCELARVQKLASLSVSCRETAASLCFFFFSRGLSSSSSSNTSS